MQISNLSYLPLIESHLRFIASFLLWWFIIIYAPKVIKFIYRKVKMFYGYIRRKNY